MSVFWRFRVLLFYTSVTIITMIFCIAFFIAAKIFNISYDKKYSIAIVFSYLFIYCGKLICGLNYSVSGLEKLPSEPSIVLANHQSFWDNVFMQIIIPKHSWIIKKELFNIPFFGWGLKMVDPVAVNRTDSSSVKQILREGQQKLQAGLWLIIFPESTRLRPEQSTNFKPSALRLAIAQKVPVVLMAHNAGVYWPKGFWVVRPGTIQVKIIDVITKKEVEESNVRDLTQRAEHIINTEKQILFEQAVKKHNITTDYEILRK